MNRTNRLTTPLLAASLLLCAIAMAGCKRDSAGGSAASGGGGAGANVTISLPDTHPPVLTKAIADRLTNGMPKDDALAVLKEAGQNATAAKAPLDPALEQEKSNAGPHQLIVTQGKRKVVLTFNNGRLVDFAPEGID